MNSSLVAGILQTLLNMMKTSDECMSILKASGAEAKVEALAAIYNEDCKEVFNPSQGILRFFKQGGNFNEGAHEGMYALS
mmetsp:Transcript_30998/g.45547  ORF Transcript_30998/g.45547 Transcript_30998/m.45547 type:complete len:80 (-) Transcript_30998:1270-1509(-)